MLQVIILFFATYSKNSKEINEKPDSTAYQEIKIEQSFQSPAKLDISMLKLAKHAKNEVLN